MTRRHPGYLVAIGAIVGFLAASLMVPLLGVELGGSSGGAALLNTSGDLDAGGFLGDGDGSGSDTSGALGGLGDSDSGLGSGGSLGSGSSGTGGTLGGGSTSGGISGGTSGGSTGSGGGSTGTAGTGSTGSSGTGGASGGSTGGSTGGSSGGSTGTGGSSGGTSGGTGSTGPLTASDRGVTPEVIRMGFVILDLAGAAVLGIDGAAIDAAAQEEEYKAFAKEINDAGGINGRKIEVYTAKYDPVADGTGQTTAQNACNYFTEDIKVFAVFAGAGGWPANLCVTKQHGTLMLNGGQVIETEVGPSAGLLYATPMLLIQQSANAVALARQLGEFQGKKIGLLYDEGTGGGRTVATEQGIKPALTSFGLSWAAEVKLSGDPNSAASQIPIAISEFQAAGVDRVVVASQVVYIAQWISQAKSQGYTPRYIFTGDAANEFTADQGTGRSATSILSISDTDAGNASAGLPPNPKMTECLDRYKKITGSIPDGGEVAWIRVGHLCTVMDNFAKVARAQGSNLTIKGVANGLGNLGAFPSASTSLSTWSASNPGGADFIRASEYTSPCPVPDDGSPCLVPVSDWFKGPF